MENPEIDLAKWVPLSYLLDSVPPDDEGVKRLGQQFGDYLACYQEQLAHITETVRCYRERSKI